MAINTKCEHCEGTGYAPEALQYYKEWWGYTEFDPISYGATPLCANNPEVIKFATKNVDHSPGFYRVHELGRPLAIWQEAKRLWSMWINMWSYHLIQADVDALIEEGRLITFTHKWKGNEWVAKQPKPTVTAAQVNTWALGGFPGHDSINSWVCIQARAKRNNVPIHCAQCSGRG